MKDEKPFPIDYAEPEPDDNAEYLDVVFATVIMLIVIGLLFFAGWML